MGDSVFKRDRIDYEVDRIRENLESFDFEPGLRPIQKASETALRNVAKWKLQHKAREQRIADEKTTKQVVAKVATGYSSNPFADKLVGKKAPDMNGWERFSKRFFAECKAKGEKPWAEKGMKPLAYARQEWNSNK